MTTEDAQSLIAFEQGLNIDQYLPPEKVAEIRQLHNQDSGRAGNGSSATSRQRTGKTTTQAREIRFPNEFKATDPLLPSSKLTEAKAMASVYPLLYVLENSIRELIKRVMSDAHGEDWWDTQMSTAKLREVAGKAAKRMKTEKTRHAWHQRRGAHPIDYVDFDDLNTIIRGKKNLFHPNIINDWEWFQHNFMKELVPSRNVVCHMNPLDSHNVSDIKTKFLRWEQLIKNALDKIPK